MNRISKVGTSICCILPKKDCNFFGWDVGDNVMVDVSKDQIVIRRLKK